MRTVLVGQAVRRFVGTVEGFSLLKRGIIGTYRHVSEAHLHRYCAEFDFRYNARKLVDADRADQNLLGAVRKRLPIGGLVLSPPDKLNVPP